jgi:8-oxo-dGTP diphosphatase
MKQRISAGVIVENEGKVLLVRHCKPGAYDFWVAPGGGSVGDEDLRATARRETFEECGLRVEPLELLYVEELVNPHTRMCKFWFAGKVLGGELTTAHQEAAAEGIVEAAWLGREAIAQRTVFPPMLRAEYWSDRERGPSGPRYVGLRRMEFW